MKNLYGFSIVNCRAMCIDLVWVGQTAWKKAVTECKNHCSVAG